MAANDSGERTEKATPKRREEARKEGQVVKSQEVNSAFAIAVGIGMLALWGPHIWANLQTELVQQLHDSAHERITSTNAMTIFLQVVVMLARTVGPFLGAMLVSGVVANVIQVKFRVTPDAIKPRFSKINPIQGFKTKFSAASLFELAKSIVKMIVVALPSSWIVWSRRDEILLLGGVGPFAAGLVAIKLIISIGLTVAGIYIVVAAADYAWQRHRFEKNLRMTKQEVKQEQRQQDVAPELKAAQRRRQRQAARKRMLADVPKADVIVTNPTHYSVALRYDSEMGAPQVVAKGVDLLAMRIREIGDENGIARVENVPLARALYAQVEVGQLIPADLFAAVAEVLAFVYQLQEKNKRAGVSSRPVAA